jgi:hypothetical protein
MARGLRERYVSSATDEPFAQVSQRQVSRYSASTSQARISVSDLCPLFAHFCFVSTCTRTIHIFPCTTLHISANSISPADMSQNFSVGEGSSDGYLTPLSQYSMAHDGGQPPSHMSGSPYMSKTHRTRHFESESDSDPQAPPRKRSWIRRVWLSCTGQCPSPYSLIVR